LSEKEAVWFGSDCSKYGDREEGLWDDTSYSEEDASTKSSKNSCGVMSLIIL